MDPIRNLIKGTNIKIIDDSAETLCATYKNKWAGIKADCSVFSFENKKHLSSGSEGGIVTTNDASYAERIRKIAGLGYKNLTAITGRTNLASSKYQRTYYERHDTIGLNYRMNAITAAVALAQLERASHLVERRIAIGKMFKEAIEGCTWLKDQKLTNESTHSYYTFGVEYLGLEKKGITWEEFYNMYTELGGDGFYAAWVNPYLEPALKNKKFGRTFCQHGLCPNAEKLQKRIMLLKRIIGIYQ